LLDRGGKKNIKLNRNSKNKTKDVSKIEIEESDSSINA
jgi:hypothetical protein